MKVCFFSAVEGEVAQIAAEAIACAAARRFFDDDGRPVPFTKLAVDDLVAQA